MLSLYLISSLAFANGQSTHCWISNQAISGLAAGELKDFLADPELEIYWRNGTMFPDGGYAIDDGYGEIAHWEPFQKKYLQWIKDNYSTPWTDEASHHIAFLLGMASHGMADQSFDSMYYRRAYIYDADGNWDVNLDEATDVTFIADTEAQPVPEKWTPTELFVELFAEEGHIVDASTINQGQGRLQIAVQWVGNVATTLPDMVEEYRQYYPWASANMLNEDYSGSPPVEANIIMAYWEYIWAELHDQPRGNSILYVTPTAGTYAHPISSDDIEADLSIVFAQGLRTDDLAAEMFSVVDPEGDFHPIGIDVFYGNQSNVVNITPLEDWKIGEHTLSISAELPFRDRTILGDGFLLHFSTDIAPEQLIEDDKRQCSVCIADTGISMLLWCVLVLRRRKPEGRMALE